jgi:hypothetical protein
MDHRGPCAGHQPCQHLRDIQAVHFGSLYLVPLLLGLT